MRLFRKHWFEFGLVLAGAVGIYLLVTQPVGVELLLWLNLIFLFLHQFEEYRYPGYFPGMINVVMFNSIHPDRYPLNENTALIINVALGWGSYFLAAIFAERAIWLGIATMLVSVGNFIAHTLLFNLKGKTIYNPGMLTAIVLFLPLSVFFFYRVIASQLATPSDWVAGIVLGIVLNYVGVLKVIDWLKDEQTPYVFPERCLIPGTRKADQDKLQEELGYTASEKFEVVFLKTERIFIIRIFGVPNEADIAQCFQEYEQLVDAKFANQPFSFIINVTQEAHSSIAVLRMIRGFLENQKHRAFIKKMAAVNESQAVVNSRNAQQPGNILPFFTTEQEAIEYLAQ